MFDRLEAMHPKGDSRRLVLAYGAWGLVAGRPNQASNKGTPPAVGAGLMKRLALRFAWSRRPRSTITRRTHVVNVSRNQIPWVPPQAHVHDLYTPVTRKVRPSLLAL